MRKGFFAYLFILGGLISGGSALAEAIGMPTQPGRVGITFGSAYFSVDDPAGDSRGDWAVHPFNLVYSKRFNPRWRYWTELFYQQGSLDADASNMGLTIKQAGARLSLQRSIDLGPVWTPWFGAGVQFSRDRLVHRYTVDSQGFLLQHLPDRNSSEMAVVLNASSEWRLEWDWDIGIKIEQALPVDDGVKTFTAALMFLYRF